MKAVRIHETGDAGVLRVDEIGRPEPGPDEVLIRVQAAGLNFIDTYHRSGSYDVELPFTLGVEAAGVVESCGGRVDDLEGRRVAYTGVPGSYAEYAAVPAHRLVAVPDGIETQVAAAVLLQGMTAHYLSHTTYPLDEGDTALVLAASGGVGHLLVQLAKSRGARVIATVSTEEKAELALGAGADEVIRYDRDELDVEVRELTDGDGVDVVYDSVGAATFAKSLNSLRPRGYLVLYGQSSGAVEPLDPQELNSHGSLFLTRPSLGHYVARREELQWRAGDLFDAIGRGALEVRIDRRFPLEDATEAHRYIEGRNTKGKVLIVPGTNGSTSSGDPA